MVEDDGGRVLVVEGGVEGVEVAVLYQKNMKNNVKRNIHNGQRKTKVILLLTGGSTTPSLSLSPFPLPLSSFSDFRLRAAT